MLNLRGIFRILRNIYDGAFFTKIVNGFAKKSHKCLTSECTSEVLLKVNPLSVSVALI